MTSLPRFVARAGAALALLAGLSGTALAQNTASNTTISNTASLTYKVGGVTQPPICSSPTGSTSTTCTPTTFQVDTKINLTVATTDVAPINTTPGGAALMTFTVTNNSNTPLDVLLSTVNNVATGQTLFGSTDSFDPTSCTVFQADGVTPFPANKIAGLAANASQTVKVSCTIPAVLGAAPLTPTDTMIAALKGQALIPGGAAFAEIARAGATPGVVLADGTGPDDLARDGTSSARSALKAAPAALTVTKTPLTLCDPSNGSTTPKAIPGAYVRYTVTTANGTAAGTASAIVDLLTDNLDVNVTFDTDYIVGTGAAALCSPVSSAGVATSGAGNVEVGVTGSTRAGFGPATFKYTTATIAGTTLTIPSGNWATLLPAEGTYAAGELKPGETITIKYNLIIK